MLYVNIVMEIVTVLSQVKIDSTAGVGCLNTFNEIGHGFQKTVNFKEKQIILCTPGFFSNAHVASSICTGGGEGIFTYLDFFK